MLCLKAARYWETKMNQEMLELLSAEGGDGAKDGAVSIGYIVEVSPGGHVSVDFPGNTLGPLAARSIVPMVELSRRRGNGQPIVLAFENGDRALPIIMGVVQESSVRDTEAMMRADSSAELEVVVDRKRIVIEAEREIVLRCGKGSIVLSRNGKIVIKGTNLASRASGQNKIKGSSVGIN